MSRALFVGRFQPFHMGHVLAIEEILRKHDHIIIIVGSARQHDTPENPFSVKERIEMLTRSLLARGIRHFEIDSIEDFNDDKLWTSAIRDAYKFDAVYSRNPWTLECFGRNGVSAKKHRLYHKRKYSGVEIRKRMAAGKGWRDLVPAEVHGFIINIKGEERVRRLLAKQS
ncbi:MAG: nicotinamide-nucleotide adenylyltransferase [Candidatus Aenigmarchaeota archaeon]|nr:nicotinamide-nucleotide adenylyltransferase [Candidatus Aenigmarchaeota archaeon]